MIIAPTIEADGDGKWKVTESLLKKLLPSIKTYCDDLERALSVIDAKGMLPELSKCLKYHISVTSF